MATKDQGTGVIEKVERRVDVIDESDDDDSWDASVEEFYEKVSDELDVLSHAASIYYTEYNKLHKASERKKKNRSILDFLQNSHKANKAAWRYIVQNSEVHKENEKRAKKFLPESSVEALHDWLADDD
jgi:hypothetical protein